jgi:tRNA(Ile)-lysidine synthase
MCEQAFLEFFRSLTPRPGKLLLSVSGGGDSVALLHLCLQLREDLGIERLAVAHVNHGLRGAESDAEEAFVAKLAEKAGLQLHLQRLGGKTAQDSGIEEWARRQRYAFLGALRQQHGFDYIATGHTAEDQAETLLLNILRGTGLAGLGGIKPVREDGVIRPLLGLRRASLRTWLQDRSLEWREDSSNSDTRFKRNWIRHSVLPLLSSAEPATVDHLLSCSQQARNFASFLEPLINTWMGRYVFRRYKASFSVRKEGLRSEPFLAAEGLVRLLKRHGIACEQLQIERILAASSRSSGEFLLPGGWRFYPDRDSIGFRRADAGGSQPFCKELLPGQAVQIDERAERITLEILPADRNGQIGFDPTNMTAYVDAGQAGNNLVYRSVNPRDRFMPLGASGEHQLTHVLKSQGIPKARRDGYGVVCQAAGAVVWVPGVAVSHRFRLTEATRQIARLTLEEIAALAAD